MNRRVKLLLVTVMVELITTVSVIYFGGFLFSAIYDIRSGIIGLYRNLCGILILYGMANMFLVAIWINIARLIIKMCKGLSDQKG